MPRPCRFLPPLTGILFAAACGHGLAPVGPGTTGLHGRVTMHGTWPADTGIVAVALFAEKPVSDISEFPVIFSEAPAFGVSSFDFTWTLPAGAYGYLVVAWMRAGDNILDLASWVELGFYPDPGNPSEPGQILITPGVFKRIDLSADFSLVPPPADRLRGGWAQR